MNNKFLPLSRICFTLVQSAYVSAQTVEEVIVTATKTERTLQEVPVAVSVVTADTIEKANVVDY